jgi:hypothetical protein
MPMAPHRGQAAGSAARRPGYQCHPDSVAGASAVTKPFRELYGEAAAREGWSAIWVVGACEIFIERLNRPRWSVSYPGFPAIRSRSTMRPGVTNHNLCDGDGISTGRPWRRMLARAVARRVCDTL